MLVKILSAGVIAALVTGVFSVITSVKTNKRLKEIELIKQKYDMKKIEYDRLETYYKELVQKEEEFEYKGGTKDTPGYYKQLFISILEKFEFMRKEHEVHAFLFDDSENKEIKEKEKIILNNITEFVLKFQNVEEPHGAEGYVNRIVYSIDEFRENYHTLLKNKIREVLDK